MLDTNEYFDGKVKSIGYKNEGGNFTVGVMVEGEYEFGTSSNEEMTVVNGTLVAQMPGSTEWTTYNAGESFNVAAGVKFKVKAIGHTSYLCRYY